MTDRRPVRRALVSVFDKSGLEDLVWGLADAGVELVSTGGTLRAGCRFLALSPHAEKQILQYIFRVERQRNARERRAV